MNDIQPSLSKRAINRKTWQQLLTQWRQSGLTAKQFCQDHRIKEADLKRWSYRLNKRQYSPVANPVPGNDSAAKKFIPVTVSQSTIESARVGSIDIMLGKNIHLRLSKQFDEELLLRLIYTLRRVDLC